MIQELLESQESKVLTLTNCRFPTRTFPFIPLVSRSSRESPWS